MTRSIIWRYARSVFYVWLGLILVVAGFILAVFPVLPGLPIVVIGIFMVAKHTGIIDAKQEKDLHARWRKFKDYLKMKYKNIKILKY